MSQDKINQLLAEYDAACHTGDEENAKAIEKELRSLGGRVATRSREDENQEVEK